MSKKNEKATPQRFEVWWAELPKQKISYKILGVVRDLESVELDGTRPFLVWAVDPSGRWISGIPLTSAQNEKHEEKWGYWRPSWARIFLDGKPNMCDAGQIRMCDRQRLSEKVGRLSEYDVEQVSLKLRGTLGLL
jgi:hypothetical protein